MLVVQLVCLQEVVIGHFYGTRETMKRKGWKGQDRSEGGKKEMEGADGLVIVQGCRKEKNNMHASIRNHATTAGLSSYI